MHTVNNSHYFNIRSLVVTQQINHNSRTQWTAQGSVFGAVCDFFVCV